MYLQDHAWSEAQKAGKLAARAARAASPHERQLLAHSPMFCFETALAMHRFSWLAYRGGAQLLALP